MGPGQNRDSPHQIGVLGQRPMHRGVGAQDIGQGHRIGVIRLLARDRVPFPIPGHRHRIDGIDRPAGRPQRRNQQPAWRLDSNRDRLGMSVTGLGEYPKQLVETLNALHDARLGQQLTVMIDDGDVVMALRPIDPAIDLHRVLLHP